MTEEYVFTNFVTKALEIGNSEERTFTGHITAEVIDKQNEFIFTDEMMPIMEKFMSRMPAITEIHTNRICGKVLSYEKSEIEGIKSIKIEAQIYKDDDYQLFDKVWKKIVNKEYKGLSIGGASKSRTPLIKNGRPTILLKDLELYEIAICPEPANPLAKIDWINEFAKNEDDVQRGKMKKTVTQCDNLQCMISKGLDVNSDIDINFKQPKKEEIRRKVIETEKMDLKNQLTSIQLLHTKELTIKCY